MQRVRLEMVLLLGYKDTIASMLYAIPSILAMNSPEYSTLPMVGSDPSSLSRVQVT